MDRQPPAPVPCRGSDHRCAEAIEENAYGPRVFEATDVQLKDLSFPYGVDATLTITYQYDFGDDWQHKLVLRRAEIEDDVKYPRCVAGDRAGPPEDVGGYPGYADFLEAWLDPMHEENKQCDAGRARSSIRSASISMRPTKPSPKPCALAEATTGEGKSEPASRPPSWPYLLEDLRPSIQTLARSGRNVRTCHSLIRWRRCTVSR